MGARLIKGIEVDVVSTPKEPTASILWRERINRSFCLRILFFSLLVVKLGSRLHPTLFISLGQIPLSEKRQAGTQLVRCSETRTRSCVETCWELK